MSSKKKASENAGADSETAVEAAVLVAAQEAIMETTAKDEHPQEDGGDKKDPTSAAATGTTKKSAGAEDEPASNKKLKSSITPTTDTTGVASAASKASPSSSASLQVYNDSFYTQVQTYYSSSQNLFAGVLLEFLKYTGSAQLHAQVFDLIAASQQDELKRVVTVDIWERVQRYVDDWNSSKKKKGKQHKAGSSSSHVMFTEADLPNLTNPTAQYISAAVAASEVAAAHGFQAPELKDSKKKAASPGGKNSSSTKRKRQSSTTSRTAAAVSASLMPPSLLQRRYLEGEPGENDVKFGRGGGTNNHKGNILYLLEKLKLQVPYTLIATQKGKTAISQQLVDTIHAKGGRFVARDDSNDESKDARWFEVDDSVARRKASQTLREDKTPRDQEAKRKTLLRKLHDLEQQPQPTEARPLTVQEQKASETLLELNAGAAAGAGGGASPPVPPPPNGNSATTATV